MKAMALDASSSLCDTLEWQAHSHKNVVIIALKSFGQSGSNFTARAALEKVGLVRNGRPILLNFET